ncbi:hypothetical protein Sjap_016098 [Stephania japonica]|uniref:Uncharacterized protein n=1 Tax=Stephania japonica TaxID=461633 RepID=A0AAP0IM01_9MAGN
MESCGARCDPRQFPLSFYYRLADQLLNQLYQEFVKELASLKPQLGAKSPSRTSRARPGCTETKDNSVLESVVQVDLSDGSSGFELPRSTTSMAWDFDTHCVTQSSPSPSISRTESVPQAAIVSHVTGSGSGLDSVKSSYQDIHLIMLRDAVAIVMAPTDSTRHYGIFRLSEPGGITVVRDCNERGFHTHQEPSDGRPIYEDCGNVYFNLNLRFEIFDLR